MKNLSGSSNSLQNEDKNKDIIATKKPPLKDKMTAREIRARRRDL